MSLYFYISYTYNETRNSKLMKTKNKIIIGLIVGIFLTPNIANAKTASVVGCNYGLGQISTQGIAEYVTEKLSNMGYQLFNTYTPTRYKLEGQTVSGQHFIQSDVVYLEGHADSSTMTFYNCGGEKVGFNKMNNTIDLGSNGYYIGIGTRNLSNVKLAMLEGCETARGSNNISSQFVAYGAKSSIGWSTEINTFSAKSWLTRFWDKINSGGTISEANDYANADWYTFSSIKNIVIYGNKNVKLNPISYSRSTLANNNSLVMKNEYIVNKKMENDINITIENTIKENVNSKFNLADYNNVKVSESNGKTIYDFGLEIDNVKVEIGYTVFVENGTISRIYDNTKGQSVDSIKKSINQLRKNVNLEHKEHVYYNYKTDKIMEYKEIVDIDEAGNKQINMVANEI